MYGGAKCQAEIITIATNFSCWFSYDKDECILLMFHFLIWTSAWNDLKLLGLSVTDCALLI